MADENEIQAQPGAPAAVEGANFDVLVDVEAAPGDRVDAVLLGLFIDPPVRLNASLSF